MKAKSIKGISTEEIKIALAESLADGYRPTLAIVFLSINQDVYDVIDDIEANLHKIHEHGTRADSIVKLMLQHSLVSDGKMEPIPFNPLIKVYGADKNI